MKCVSCNRPIGHAAVMVGAYAYGPKCARKAGLIVSAPVAAVKQPVPDGRQMPLGLTVPATAKQGRARQKPPKPTAKAKTKSRKLMELAQ